MRKALAVLVLFLMTGCFLGSGTWDNDEGNWRRIFGEEKPRDIHVNNSRYWKSPHFTYEYSFFIELQKNKRFIAKIKKAGDLKKVLPENAELDFFDEKPIWFIPKNIDDYEVWQAEDEFNNMQLYIDKENGTIFLTDYQV